jgi:hypothetical protein
LHREPALGRPRHRCLSLHLYRKHSLHEPRTSPRHSPRVPQTHETSDPTGLLCDRAETRLCPAP